MSEPQIGRALASGLHQAITELMPTRVEFYESWITPKRIREGQLGRARVTAVISFLREEAAYEAVMLKAGRYTTDWTLDTLSGTRRAILNLLPRPLRVRGVLRVANWVVRGFHDEVRLKHRVHRGVAVVTVEGSLFCQVREPTERPMCRFYCAVIERCLEVFGLEGEAESSKCCAIGQPACELPVDMTGRETLNPP